MLMLMIMLDRPFLHYKSLNIFYLFQILKSDAYDAHGCDDYNDACHYLSAIEVKMFSSSP